MTPIEKAQALLALDPLPGDAEQQLEALAEEAGQEYGFEFDQLFEALFVRMNGG